MNSKQKIAVWAVLTISIFSLFKWLFDMAIPEIALSFAIGITVVLVGGLFSGHIIYNVWLRNIEHWHKVLFVTLIISIPVMFVGVSVLVGQMIKKTEFMLFSVTVMLLFLIALCIGILISLVRNHLKNKVQKAHVALAHSKQELQILQSQLSPHFLFNTLNNIYGLSLNDHQKVPALLLKLSDMLRYSVYDVKEAFVSLEHELDYLKNYIEFEKLRLGSRLELNVNFNAVEDNAFKIPPMLLIVFIENAFKHSRDTRTDKIVIDMTLSNTRDEVVFFVRNSCFQPEMGSTLKQKHSGFGLESVRKRLDLLYENRHDLKITESANDYTVNLKLKR